jgi:hypothetical protein
MTRSIAPSVSALRQPDRPDLLFRHLLRLAGDLYGVDAVVEVDDLGVELGLVEKFDDLGPGGQGTERQDPGHDGAKDQPGLKHFVT